MQEAYAAFLSHTDQQIARFADFLDREGELNNTIFLVLSDNGAANSQPQHGMLDVRRVAYQEPESLDFLADNIDLIGTEHSQCMYGPGWSHAGNTPLKWYKGDTYGGGTRSPLIVHWPDGGLARGEIRTQYHHAIDVVPSLLEMINEQFPNEIDGTPQMPLQGDSFAYAIDNAEAPTTKSLQYYETLGDRALWSDGWKAVVRHQGDGNFEDDVWELYHTDADFSETENLAEIETDRLMALVALWDREAHRHGILPMARNTLELYQNVVPPARSHYRLYPGMARLDRLSAPDIYNYDSRISAHVEIDDGIAEGVLLVSGDGGAGYDLFLKDGYVVFEYVYTREQRFVVRSSRRVTAGTGRIDLELTKTGESSAAVAMLFDSEVVANGEIPRLWPIYAPNAGVRCGENSGAPVSQAYSGSFPFNQTLHRVEVDIDLASGAVTSPTSLRR